LVSIQLNRVPWPSAMPFEPSSRFADAGSAVKFSAQSGDRFSSREEQRQSLFSRRQLLGSGFKALVIAALGIPLLQDTASAQGNPQTVQQPDYVAQPNPSRDKIDWHKNIKVLASSGERFYSWYWSAPYNQKASYFFYTKALLDTLKAEVAQKPGAVMGLEQAHGILENKGYEIPSPKKDESLSPFEKFPEKPKTEKLSGKSLLYPISTQRQLGSWQINTPKTRYAVLIGQSEPLPPPFPLTGQPDTFSPQFQYAQGFNNAVMRDFDDMEEVLKDPKLFNLPTENILRIDGAEKKDVEQSVRWLKDKAKPGDELLFFYNGHGESSKPGKNAKEGDARGRMCGPDVNEHEFRRWVHRDLDRVLEDRENPAKLLIMMDTCHAGSMVAENLLSQKNYRS
jgi:hypothetical protein